MWPRFTTVAQFLLCCLFSKQIDCCRRGFFFLMLRHDESFSCNHYRSFETAGLSFFSPPRCDFKLIFTHPLWLFSFSTPFRCSWSTAYTHCCSGGWLASASALTSARWPPTAFGKTVTRLFYTCCQRPTLTWPANTSSRTRRAYFFTVLSLTPLITVSHLKNRDCVTPCRLD